MNRRSQREVDIISKLQGQQDEEPKKTIPSKMSLNIPWDLKKQKGELDSLVKQMNTEIKDSDQSIKKAGRNIIKGMVSKNKRRTQLNGFNLDLSYITSNIIAMGYPAQSIESVYRNKLEDVKAFFDQRHPGHYKLFNLCSDKKKYDHSLFEGRVVDIGFKDHCSPPFELVIQFCEIMHQFLNEDKENVAAVHCKAGKGRTGTMICCYLQWSGKMERAYDSLYYYGKIRTKNGKGVTIPSQIRTVYYYEKYLKEYKQRANKGIAQLDFSEKKRVKILSVTLLPLGSSYASVFRLKDLQASFKLEIESDLNKESEWDEEMQSVEFDDLNYDGSVLKLTFSHLDDNVTVTNDFRLSFYKNNELLFSVCYNTHFIPSNGIIWNQKQMLDKLQKDKTNKKYSEIFQLKIQTVDCCLLEYADSFFSSHKRELIDSQRQMQNMQSQQDKSKDFIQRRQELQDKISMLKVRTQGPYDFQI